MSFQLLEQFLNYLTVEKGLREKTIAAYRSDLEDWIKFAEERERNIIKPGVENLLSLYSIEMHDQDFSPRTMARKTSALRGFYRFLQRESIIDCDPMAYIERPKTGRPLPKVLSRDEMELILEQPDTSKPLGIRDKAMMELLYATGIRESELIDIQIGDINFQGEFISVKGKGGKERVVPVGDLALEAVQSYLFKARNTLCQDITERTMFLNSRGNPLSRMGVWKIIRKYALSAGLGKDVSPHIFRHSCATHMLEGGAGIMAVQEMLGHADISTTQIYTHLSTKELRNIHKSSHPRSTKEKK